MAREVRSDISAAEILPHIYRRPTRVGVAIQELQQKYPGIVVGGISRVGRRLKLDLSVTTEPTTSLLNDMVDLSNLVDVNIINQPTRGRGRLGGAIWATTGGMLGSAFTIAGFLLFGRTSEVTQAQVPIPVKPPVLSPGININADTLRPKIVVSGTVVAGATPPDLGKIISTPFPTPTAILTPKAIETPGPQLQSDQVAGLTLKDKSDEIGRTKSLSGSSVGMHLPPRTTLNTSSRADKIENIPAPKPVTNETTQPKLSPLDQAFQRLIKQKITFKKGDTFTQKFQVDFSQIGGEWEGSIKRRDYVAEMLRIAAIANGHNLDEISEGADLDLEKVFREDQLPGLQEMLSITDPHYAWQFHLQ